MNTLYLVQGDNGTQVKVEITRDDTGLPVDLTGATPALKFKKKNTGNVLATINSAVTDADDIAAGLAIFQFTSQVLEITAGDYVAEIEVTFGDGTVETVYEELQFTVREDY